MQEIMSVRELADFLNVPRWNIRRVFETGEVTAPLVAGCRVMTGEVVPQVIDALRQHGWLPSQQLEKVAA